MKTRNKVIALALCAVTLVGATVLGTMAYLTSTDEVKNTFTVGRVSISLDEAKVDEDGNAIDEKNEVVTNLEDAQRVKSNEYHLLPGHTYVKDPTIHINAESEEAYYRMIVTVSFAEGLDDANLATKLDGIFIGHDGNKWSLGGDKKTVSADKKVITYEYRYYTTVAGNEDKNKDLEPLFTHIVVPEELTNEQLAVFAGMEIDIVAHAIQKDGFADADTAWTAFDASVAP